MGRNQVKQPIITLKTSTEASASFCSDLKRLFIFFFLSSEGKNVLGFIPSFFGLFLIHLVTSLMDMSNYSRFLVLAYRWKPGQRHLYKELIFNFSAVKCGFFNSFLHANILVSLRHHFISISLVHLWLIHLSEPLFVLIFKRTIEKFSNELLIFHHKGGRFFNESYLLFCEHILTFFCFYWIFKTHHVISTSISTPDLDNRTSY